MNKTLRHNQILISLGICLVFSIFADEHADISLITNNDKINKQEINEFKEFNHDNLNMLNLNYKIENDLVILDKDDIDNILKFKKDNAIDLLKKENKYIKDDYVYWDSGYNNVRYNVTYSYYDYESKYINFNYIDDKKYNFNRIEFIHDSLFNQYILINYEKSEWNIDENNKIVSKDSVDYKNYDLKTLEETQYQEKKISLYFIALYTFPILFFYFFLSNYNFLKNKLYIKKKRNNIFLQLLTFNFKKDKKLKERYKINNEYFNSKMKDVQETNKKNKLEKTTQEKIKKSISIKNN